MFYPLVYGKDNIWCARHVCLKGQNMTGCDELTAAAKRKESGSATSNIKMKMGLCQQEMCRDTYAYTVWLGMWA